MRHHRLLELTDLAFFLQSKSPAAGNTAPSYKDRHQGRFIPEKNRVTLGNIHTPVLVCTVDN
jgi:hypothetical protein